MPKPTRIYTRTGDDGTTGLIGGRRVPKHEPRLDAYGTLDELSAAIGLARTALAEIARSRAVDQAKAVAAAATLDAWLAWTQDKLFDAGCELATLPEDRHPGLPVVSGDETAALERAIDAAQRDLPPLAHFIHPGGAYPGAFLHQARTVARRAERSIVALAETDVVSPALLAFVNRLSDALFVWSRAINHALDRPEHRWDQDAKPPA